MPILIFTLIAHVLFTVFNVYWIIPWSDNVVHACMGAGLVILFVKNIKWSKLMALVALLVLAVGWEYVEHIRDDAVSDIIYGMIGGIIAAIWIKK